MWNDVMILWNFICWTEVNSQLWRFHNTNTPFRKYRPLVAFHQPNTVDDNGSLHCLSWGDILVLEAARRLDRPGIVAWASRDAVAPGACSFVILFLKDVSGSYFRVISENVKASCFLARNSYCTSVKWEHKTILGYGLTANSVASTPLMMELRFYMYNPHVIFTSNVNV